ncbi:S8 family peptidase [Fischerella sp. PCC 9605]|uniref:S8 family peptidase n=1 Tax=Fischerella sp. PCC 9605 TaxID=1173024 RepID=UPI00047BBEA5|nr:S8 family serine peptidase [Fischerella sp. PCC 9605]
MTHLGLVKLTKLMELTSGRPEIGVGLIDGPVSVNHSGLSGTNIREISGKLSSNCTHATSIACLHGTFVAGILCANRNSLAPAICPNCTLLIRPIFAETTSASEQIPSATPEELAAAIIESIDAGVRVLNMSVALAQPSSKGQRELEQALGYATKRGVIIVAAAGNQGTLGSSVITRHPWVIPVVACDLQGRPISQSNLGTSIGKQGLRAPGDNITSLGVKDQPLTLGGTSVAAPFVTGAIALLWSLFPDVIASEVKLAITQAHMSRRTTVIPPLLDAWAAYQLMLKSHS